MVQLSLPGRTSHAVAGGSVARRGRGGSCLRLTVVGLVDALPVADCYALPAYKSVFA